MKLRALKAAFPHTIPVLMGYMFLGFAFGILLSNKGYHFGWAFLMSLTIFAGSMQFVAVNLLSVPLNIVNLIVMTFMINARHLFYGLSLLDKFKAAKLTGKKKWYQIFSLTDETYSLLCSVRAPENVNQNWFYFFIAILNHSYWCLGSVLGAAAGSLITFNSKGIDFVMTALFVVIFVNQWKSTKNHIPALTGILGSLLCLIIFEPTNFIIPSMVVIIIALTLFRKPIEEKSKINSSKTISAN